MSWPCFTGLLPMSAETRNIGLLIDANLLVLLAAGLTDAALLEVVSDATPLVTVDLDLYLAASRRAPNAALNFRHLTA